MKRLSLLVPFALAASLAACGPSALELKTAADAKAAADARAAAKERALADEEARMAAEARARAAADAKAAAEAQAAANAANAARPSCRAGMKVIAKGSFTMGSETGEDDEKKTHSVTVAAFCMDATEVTTAAYTACVNGGNCGKPEVSTPYNFGWPGRENHPINGVDWEQATIYCATHGLRLPTEEEWEYAARGADGRTYPWGNDAPDKQLCWDRFGPGKANSTCAVGSFPLGDSPFGLSDMSGNVWEWTSSGYVGNYGEAPFENVRVIRGGGDWHYGDPLVFRSSNRTYSAPALRGGALGFRCAGSTGS